MKFKFLDWYTQALGSTFGILACIYAYLNGYMFVYGNIESYFDHLGFSGVISSYILLPLCLINLSLSLVKSYTIKKQILNTSFESVNVFISILTVIIGFMGAKIYFLIPAIFILFNILEPSLQNSVNLENEEILLDTNKKDNIMPETKKEIAIQLLRKNCSKQFIVDLTGFTLDEINILDKELRIKNK